MELIRTGGKGIPAPIRKRYHIEHGDGLVWLDEGGVIRVVPVAADPVKGLRGAVKGAGLLDSLLEDRRRDRERE